MGAFERAMRECLRGGEGGGGRGLNEGELAALCFFQRLESCGG